MEEIFRRLKPSHHWEFIKATESQSLMWVHQTTEQQRLLKLYGDEICLLDATHKTTRYGLPLFFVVVKTNIDYQVIGSFVIAEESYQAISKALTILKSWNDSWNPRTWMTDCCTAEISAVESVFPGTPVSKFVATTHENC